MISAQMAEHFAQIAWESIQSLMSSEVAAQEAIAGTPLDFEWYAKQYLVRAFMLGKPEKLPKAIDAKYGERHEDQTGDYHFADPKNLAGMTYAQAMMALTEQVPAGLRLKFKQLHAKGEKTPYENYAAILAEWKQIKEQMEGDEGTAAVA